MNTSMGLDENIEGVLSYSILFISGIIMLVLERQSSFVKFHAIQSIAVFLPLFIISQVVNEIPVFGQVISTFLGLIMIIFWLFLMYKAFKGQMFKVPVLGDYAERQIGK